MSTRAFTLIETLTVIAITALISVTLGVLLVYFYKTNTYTLEQSIAVGQARRGVENSMRDLREASYGNDGSYPIANAATSSITFYANVDTDSVIEKVTYTLQEGSFYRVVVKPIGNPLTYTNGTTSTSTVATLVVNTSIFRYFDNTSVELPAPVNI